MITSDKLTTVINQIQYVTDDIATLATHLLSYTDKKINYLDYGYDDGKVIFTALPNNVAPINSVVAYSHESRQKVTLGKLLNTCVAEVDENSKRQFTELVSARIKSNYQGIEIEVLSGEDLRDAYHPDNYAPSDQGGNINSCLAHVQYQLNMDFYVYNPESVRILVARLKKKLVSGRALIYTAYESIDDLKERKNARTILGRSYVAKTSIRVLFEEWYRKNADFRIESQSSFDYKAKRFDNKLWYIPLQHWDLNYYPYMDHFSTVYKDLVKGVGVWTNDVSYHRKHKYILPGKDGYTDSEIKTQASKPDPFRPGLVWIISKKKWLSADAYTLINGVYLEKHEIGTCDVCNEQCEKARTTCLYDKRKACNKHATIVLTTGLFALQDDAEMCKSCAQWSLKDEFNDKGICNTCKDKITECSCGRQVDSNFMFTIFDDSKLCPECVDGVYSLCDTCWKLQKNVTKQKNGEFLCPACVPVVKIETPVIADSPSIDPMVSATTERCMDSEFIEISPNAIKLS